MTEHKTAFQQSIEAAQQKKEAAAKAALDALPVGSCPDVGNPVWVGASTRSCLHGCFCGGPGSFGAGWENCPIYMKYR